MVTPFVGRRTELDTALDAFGRVAAGGLQVVTVVGEPGIGKTRLLGAIATAVTRDGATVLQGGITAAEATLAWAGLVTLLRPADPAWFDGLAPLPRAALCTALGRAAADAVVASHQVAHGLTGLLDAATAGGATAVVVDDVHWLDQASAAALSFAMRALTHRPLLVILGWRRHEPAPIDVDHLVDPERVHRIELAGLSLGAIHEVLRTETRADLRRPVLARIHERTGGNPLHALELARLLTPDGRLEQAVPPSLRASIAAHLAALTPEAQAVLTTAALLVTPTVTVLAEVHPATDTHLDAAEQLRIVTVDAGTVRFTHPLLAAALLDDLGGLARRNLHRRLAGVVLDPEARAVHLAAATDGPDEAVATALEEAGDLALRRGATELAAERLEAAFDRTPGEQREAWERRAAAAVGAALDAGADDIAIRIAREALATTIDPVRVAEIGAAAALALNRRHSVSAARALVEPLLDRLDDHPGPRSRLLRSLTRLLHFDDMVAGLATAGDALDAARQAGDPTAVADAELLLANSRCLVGQPVDLDGVRAGTIERPPGTTFGASWFLGELLVWSDRHDEAEAHLGVLLARARAEGDVTIVLNALSQLGDSALRAGRWSAAEARFREVLDTAHVLLVYHHVAQDAGDLAWVLAAQGRIPEAEALVAGSELDGPGTNHVLTMHRAARAGFVALAAGRTSDAAELLGRAHAIGETLGFRDPRSLPFRADLAEALVAAGRTAEAAAVADWLDTAAASSGSARAETEAAYSRGLVAGATGDLAGAAAALADAAARADAAALPFEAARARLALGSVRRRAGQRTEARAALAAARAAFEALGARPWLERAAAELGRLGDRRAAGGVPGDLTPTEQRVAALVAAGRTNAEVATELFVSLRTVESNLTRVYRKLGVRSRTELAARLRP